MSEPMQITAPRAESRDRWILDHIPLLRHIVGRMSIPGGLDRDDLFGFGMLGLIAAADSFDESRGLKFSTYAYAKIRGAILDEVRRSDFLPRGWREKIRDLDRAVAKHEQAHGTPPSPEELAATLGLTLDEVDELFAYAKSASEVSLDDEVFSQDLGAMLSDPRSEDPVGSSEWREMKELLVLKIQELSESEKTVVTLYYGEELLLREIAEILGVTESRVSQIHSRALYRLNRSMSPMIGAEGS